MRTRPLIGITCDLQEGLDTRGGRAESFTCPVAYAWCVSQAGGKAILLPHIDPSNLDVLDNLHGLIIAGGAFDVPPDFYNESPHPKLGATDLHRSTFERALCRKALRKGLPLLGICGGMQLLNVVTGGSLFQDLSLRPNFDRHEQHARKHEPQHEVVLTPNTKVAQALNAECISVNSTHHQGIKTLGRNLRVAAHAPDGLVEAIEHLRHPFAIGVQWHPEAMAAWKSIASPPSPIPGPGACHAEKLYTALVAHAQAYRERDRLK